MTSQDTDHAFEGSIPELYERFMVPMVFQLYAEDLARRVAALKPSRVLETAAGTGVLTRELANALPADVEIIATDLNQPMLDAGAQIGTSRPVVWQHANALDLPFEDESFDVVVCQFGVMFFPDQVAGHAEARRVLRPGGSLVFNTWDRIEDNEFAHEAQLAVNALFPDEPPLFMQRVPHGYYDRNTILGHVAAAGFTMEPTFETMTETSRVTSARVPAVALCQGTPWNHELSARAASSGISVDEMTGAAETAIARRFGDGAIEGKIQGFVVTVVK
jgi:ubiquinone/menaquinone biosynthesis C-methylase UbiE